MPSASLILNLQKMFSAQAMIRTIKLNGAADTYTVENGKRVIILGGTIHHVTATPSEILIHNYGEPTDYVIQNKIVPAATATSVHNIYSTTEAVTSATEVHPAWSPIILGDKSIIAFSGDATAYCDIEVLEWFA